MAPPPGGVPDDVTLQGHVVAPTVKLELDQSQRGRKTDEKPARSAIVVSQHSTMEMESRANEADWRSRLIEGTGRFKLWGILKTTTKMVETFEEEDGSGNGEVRQSIELFKDYLKMVDGRKKRQTESEKARLMLAWMILKRRHEKRQRTTTDMERETASPPRMKKTATPRSPTNPAEELRQTRQQLSPSSQFKGIKQEEFYNQLKCMCLRRRKSNLERWFHSVKVQDHRVRFQPVIDELMKQSKCQAKIKMTNKQRKQKRFSSIVEAAFWEDWEGWNDEDETHNQLEMLKTIREIQAASKEPQVKKKKRKQKNRKRQQKQKMVNQDEADRAHHAEASDTIRLKYQLVISAADNVIQAANKATTKTNSDNTTNYDNHPVIVAADKAIRQAEMITWARDTSETIGNLNNNYFFHRGRPPDKDKN